MRLFICYARVDAYRVRELVDILRTGGHDPWFDYGLLPGQDWQAQLLEQIKASDAFVYALSPESVASEWCQWEFAEAIKLGKPVIPVLLQENAEPPEVLGRYQWADFTDGPTPEAVARLMGGLAQVTVTIPAEDAPIAPANPSGQPAQIVIHGDVIATTANIGSGTQTVQGDVTDHDKIAHTDEIDNTPAVSEPFDIDNAMDAFDDAYEGEDWQTALVWLERIRESGLAPSFFVAEEYEQTIQAGIIKQEHQATIEREYAMIRRRVERNRDPQWAWDTLQRFWQTSPGYDPDDLGRVLGKRLARPVLDTIANPNTEPKQRAEAGHKLAELGDPRSGVGLRADGLPDIDWVEIPAAEFIYGESMILSLNTFYIARYPVTFAQFQTFLDAPDGFDLDEWWVDLALEYQQKQAMVEQTFKYVNHPREMVSWFQAVAFCRWLSAKLERDISLPTEQEWEKAARGIDGRPYPYGNEFDTNKGNTALSGIGQTSAVGVFPAGASPYGVLDMNGNVWEWCLNEYDNPENTQLEGDARRVVRGGSWLGIVVNAHTALRLRSYPYFQGSSWGFRVCCVRPPSL